MYQYRLFYPVDFGDEWVHGHKLPHRSLCFRKPNLSNPRVTRDDISRAKATIAQRERDEAHGGCDNAAQIDSAQMRANVDWHANPNPANPNPANLIVLD